MVIIELQGRYTSRTPGEHDALLGGAGLAGPGLTSSEPTRCAPSSPGPGGEHQAGPCLGPWRTGASSPRVLRLQYCANWALVTRLSTRATERLPGTPSLRSTHQRNLAQSDGNPEYDTDANVPLR